MEGKLSQLLGGNQSSSGQSSEDEWNEIAELQERLIPLSNTSTSSNLNTIDPFRLELVYSVFSDLEESANELTIINNLVGSSTTIIDDEIYSKSSNTTQNPTRLKTIQTKTNELIKRSAFIQEEVDKLLNINERIVDNCNRVFLIVDEQVNFVEEKGRLKI